MSDFSNNNAPNTLKQVDDPYLTLHQVADHLNVCYETARKRVNRGEMSSFRPLGCSIRVRQSALNKYLERNTWPAQENPLASSKSPEKTVGTSKTAVRNTRRVLLIDRKLNNG